MAAVNILKVNDIAFAKAKCKGKSKDKAKGKEQGARKPALRCRCLCEHPSHLITHPGIPPIHRSQYGGEKRPRCVFRDDHKLTEPVDGIGMTHVCAEHLRIEIDRYRRDADGKIMVPHTLVSKLKDPLDLSDDIVTDMV